MTLDFQQLLKQVKQLGENARARQHELEDRREKARELLRHYASQADALSRKVQAVVQSHDPTLRCALPNHEPLNGHFPLPPLPDQATVLAADGSQINPDRHAEVNYALINVGAICMLHNSPENPHTYVQTQLLYEEDAQAISEATLALRRDLNERRMLAELAEGAAPPVLSFTDGPMELWGARDAGGEEASQYQKSLAEYLAVLSRLHELGVATAGYVDKPAANLALRLLEVACTPENELADIRNHRPLQGVTDLDLFTGLLDTGERSAVFGIQSQAARSYRDELALHFFYLNAGRPGERWLARVEIPAWVAEDQTMLDNLHAILVKQCQMTGVRPYPYLLHRAHETAVVSLQEKEQVTQMIVAELRRRGVPVGKRSHKQSAKDLPGRTRL